MPGASPDSAGLPVESGDLWVLTGDAKGIAVCLRADTDDAVEVRPHRNGVCKSDLLGDLVDGDAGVAYWEALHPYSAGGAYVNMMMDEGTDRIKAAYRDNYDRLVTAKTRYDPNNLFHINQNIKPTG